jgi:hypothetical protein
MTTLALRFPSVVAPLLALSVLGSLCCDEAPPATPPGDAGGLGRPARADDRCRTYFLDVDGDGYGSVATVRCDGERAPPPGYVTTGGDCCDADPDAHPGQTLFGTKTTACGTFDFNCDGVQEPQVPACPVPCGALCPLGLARRRVALVQACR